VLIIVLWVAFGLVALALYFADSMSLELRAADNAVATLAAEKAVEGAARYMSNILARAEIPGVLPNTNRFPFAALPIGDATCWVIGQADALDPPALMRFGLIDESSKLNLNTATRQMLEALPWMPPQLAAAIIDWRDTDDTTTEGGAETELYMRLDPPYRCKNLPFESVDELRLVLGAELDLLFGEDVNRNGVLDSNENDGEQSPPSDNRDGRLDAGLLAQLTVYSRVPLTTTNGASVVNVGAANMQQQLAPVLQERLGTDRANAILRRLAPAAGGGRGGRGGGGGQQTTPTTFRSVLEFYVRSGMTASEFELVEDRLRNPGTNGLVNVNTASEGVLACLPNVGHDRAVSLAAYRRSQSAPLSSVAWVRDVLGDAAAIQAGPYLTGRSYQFSADIAAVGPFGRGYKRIKYVFDTSQGAPRIIARHDLTAVGWALGKYPAQLALTRSSR
jgi:type II secretory pathway component PulK